VTMAEVIGALEGLPHFEQSTSEESASDTWAVRWICGEIDEAMARVLREITIETLLTRKQARDNVLMYQI